VSLLLSSPLATVFGFLRPFLAQATEDSFWMPVGAASGAQGVDRLFYLIFWISVVFFVLIVGLMSFFAVRYRRRRADERAPDSASHNTALEITWTIVPVIIVVVIFVLGFRGFLDMVNPPSDAYEVLVTGQKWKWFFTYPNGYVDEDLHVPLDRPVRLVMTSEDVIHSLYVPAFRLKKDVVPGRYAKAWFRATAAGEYELFCAEYCGTSHSDMIARVIVEPQAEFDAWLEASSNFLETLSPAEAGERLYSVRGCKQCHRVDGQDDIGPTFKGLFGRERVLQEGGTVTADENYLRESILDPQARVVAGYDPVMPTYQGRLSDREITALIEFLKTLAD